MKLGTYKSLLMYSNNVNEYFISHILGNRLIIIAGYPEVNEWI